MNDGRINERTTSKINKQKSWHVVKIIWKNNKVQLNAIPFKLQHKHRPSKREAGKKMKKKRKKE